MKLESFFKDQNLIVKNGKITKKEQTMEEQKQQKEKELKKMGYGPNGEILDKNLVNNFDPINQKKYSSELFEKKDAIPYSNEMLDTFSDDNSLYNFINEPTLFIEEENLKNNEEKDSFEDENIQEYWIKQIKNKKKNTYEVSDIYKKMPEYSDFEKAEMRRNFESWLDKKNGCFIDSEKLSKEETLGMVKEFRDGFPIEFTKMIDHKILTTELGEFKWEKEERDGKQQMVSYYPSKENCFIKYINKDYNFKNLDKVFINGVFDQSKKNNKRKSVIVFCSAPKSYKIKK